MAPPKPTAIVDIGDGTDRTLTFDFAVAWEFEEATGLTLADIDAGVSAKHTSMLLAEMLREHDAEITAKYVARHIHPGNMSEIVGKIREVLGDAEEPADDGESDGEDGQRPSD